MPFKEEMSWDASKKRWHRMHQGVMYRLPASKLGPVPTRDATRAAANEWWRKKQAELDGAQEPDEYTAFFDTVKDEPRSEGQRVIDEITDDIVPLSAYKMAVEGAEYALGRPAKLPERTVKAAGESFLDVERGRLKPRSYEELAAYVKSLTAEVGPEEDVGVFDEEKVEQMYLALRDGPLSPGRKKKFWGFFRRFIAYLAEKKVIPTPGNLYSKRHKFKVPPQEIKKYSLADVRRVLKSLKSRLKLYALLGLNCGMVNVDMASLKKSEVDLRVGTITRRRTKTGDNDNVPVVCYKLWPETLKLLKKLQSTHPTLFLTNMRGNPLCGTRIEAGSAKRYDMVVQQWRRAEPGIPLKAFRSIAATMLESHEIFGRCTSLFLGHSPKSIKDKHYAAPPQRLFDEAISWLHDQLFKA